MAEFSRLVITQKGQQLISKIFSGTTGVKFTRISTSSKAYKETELSGLEALEEIRQTNPIAGIERTESAAVKVVTAFTNSELTEGYYLRSMGLFAEDPDEGEILYGVTAELSGNCYMPPYNGVTLSALDVEMVTAVGNAENISLEVDPAAAVTVEQLNALRSRVEVLEGTVANIETLIIPVYVQSENLIPLVSGEKLSAAFSKLAKAVSELISHLTDRVKHITASERSKWNAAEKAAANAQTAANGALEQLSKIARILGAVPSQNGSLTYNGNRQTPSWNNYDSEKMTIGGVISGTDAGTYTVTFTPKGEYMWGDETNNPVSVTWTIERQTVSAVPAQSGTLTYTGGVQAPTWSNYDASKLNIGGITNSTNAGTFTAAFTPTANYCWSDGGTGAKNVSWTMRKAAGSLSLGSTSVTLNSSALNKTITVTRVGDGAITARSSNTAVATVFVSGTVVTISNVNQTKGTANITVSVADGTNHTAPASKVCAVTASFLPAKATLNSMSWADINTVCQAGKASQYWSRGDTKSITLSTGEVITVRIEDFNHDDLTTGGKAPITFGMVDCLNTCHQMDSSNKNNCGWEGSTMRVFMSTLFDQLPSDLRSVIKSVTKTTSRGGGYSYLKTTSDKLWLFSYNEVNFANDTGYTTGGEGTAYPLFISDSSRVKKVKGSAMFWWLRSPLILNDMSFVHVYTDGRCDYTSSNSSYGVVVGFCL